MADLTIRDSNSRLRVHCLRKDGSIFDLTGYSVRLLFRIGTVYHPSVDMINIDALLGLVEYQFDELDLAEEGIMYAEIEVVEIATDKVTSSAEVLILTVRGKVV